MAALSQIKITYERSHTASHRASAGMLSIWETLQWYDTWNTKFLVQYLIHTHLKTTRSWRCFQFHFSLCLSEAERAVHSPERELRGGWWQHVSFWLLSWISALVRMFGLINDRWVMKNLIKMFFFFFFLYLKGYLFIFLSKSHVISVLSVSVLCFWPRALRPPGWLPQWHCGVRVNSNQKLVGFISAIPANIRIYDM